MNTEELARKVLSIINDVSKDRHDRESDIKDLVKDQIPKQEFKFGDPVLARDSCNEPWVSGLFVSKKNGNYRYRVISKDHQLSVSYYYCKLNPDKKSITMHKWSGGKCPCPDAKVVVAKYGNGRYTAEKLSFFYWGSLESDAAIIEYAVLE